MAVSIANRTYNAVTDKRVVLAPGQIMRKISLLPADWTTIRFGILYSFVGAANITGTPRFVIGFQSGDVYGYLDGTLQQNFFGFEINTTTWPYVAGPPSYYGSTTSRGIRITNGVKSVIGSNVTEYFTNQPDTRRGAMILQVQKGATWNIDWGNAGSVASVQTDITDAKFTALMEMVDVFNVIQNVESGYQTNRISPTAATVDEATYPMNTFHIAWNNSVPFEIERVVWRKVA